MKQKHCIDCGKEEIVERRRCLVCAKAYNRERAKKIYASKKEAGIKLPRYGTGICAYCGKEMVLNKPNQLMHKKCYLAFVKKPDYNVWKRDKKGSMIGRSTFIMYKSIPEDWVVHHIDEDPENNDTTNLIALSRSDHNKLHAYLRRIRSALLKDNVRMDENCWKTLRVQETTTWLEMTSVNVLKISEIGQSASELLA